MSIAPVVATVTLGLPQARAFTLFASRMGAWWTPGKTIGANPHAEIVLEPRAGGRWYERDAAGAETDWGTVIAWDEPDRLLLAWQLDAAFKYDAAISTEVEVTFVALAEGTRVTLEHRQLERFGPSAQRVAELLSGGWPTLLTTYATHAEEKVA